MIKWAAEFEKLPGKGRIMMKSVSIFSESIDVRLKTGPDIYDITSELDRLIDKSDIGKGSLCATMVGSTGSITTIEFEPGVVEDLKRAINRLAPPDLETSMKRPGMTAMDTAMSNLHCWGLLLCCLLETEGSSWEPGSKLWQSTMITIQGQGPLRCPSLERPGKIYVAV